jgi:hypothetical protein
MSQQVRTLRIDQKERVETGAVEFQYSDGNTDWPGIFIRGDNAFGLALGIQSVVAFFKEYEKTKPLPFDLFMGLQQIAGLADTIHGEVIVGGASPGLEQKIKDQQIDRKIAEAGV